MFRLLEIGFVASSLFAVACVSSDDVTTNGTDQELVQPPNGDIALAFLDTSQERGIPEWDTCRGKASCTNGEGIVGISEVPGGPNRGALCRHLGSQFSIAGRVPIALDGYVDVRRARHMPDWAPEYLKLECGVGESVLGVSENASQCQHDNHFHALLCGPAPGVSNDCHIVAFDGHDNPGIGAPGDWDPGAFKGECGAGQYLAGVSVEPNSRRAHSLLCCNVAQGIGPFVTRSGRNFMLYGMPFKHTAANMQALVFETPDQQRKDLDGLASDGVREVRVLIGNNALTKEQIGDRLQRSIDLAKARAIKMTIVFTGNYGFAKYDLWTPPNDPDNGAFKKANKYIQGDDGYVDQPSGLFGDRWLSGGYTANYKPFVEYMVTRFRNESTIMAWEVTGEIFSPSFNIPLLTSFYLTMSQRIKQLDPNHLVTPGFISTQQVLMTNPATQNSFFGDPSIDYISAHSYNDENRDDSAIATRLNKPYVIAEFGFNTADPTAWKNRVDSYLSLVYDSENAQSAGFWAVEYDIPHGDGDSQYADGRHVQTQQLWHKWLSRMP